jgi:hypothetical protein
MKRVLVLVTLTVAVAMASADEPKAVERAKVGAPAPSIAAINPDGNALLPEHTKGKAVLVVFWRLEKDAGLPLERLRKLRTAYARNGRFLILTVCTNAHDDNWAKWSRYLLAQGEVDYGDGKRRFIDDSRWWNTAEDPSVRRVASRAYRVERSPEYHVISPGGVLAGSRVAEDKLTPTIDKALAAP